MPFKSSVKCGFCTNESSSGVAAGVRKYSLKMINTLIPQGKFVLQQQDKEYK